LKLFLSEELKTSSISSELVHELTVLFPTCKKNGFLCAVLLLGSLAHLVLESDVSSALEEQRRCKACAAYDHNRFVIAADIAKTVIFIDVFIGRKRHRL
jgi:hypothetical protein